MNLSQIYEGWKNNLFPSSTLKEVIQQTSELRLNVCAECPHHSKNHKTVRPDDHCTYCGCTLAAKTKCLSCSCPIGKWKEVVTLEKENEIKKQVQGDTLEGHAEQQ